MKRIVDYALEIATEAHKGQTRWDGTPYIEHPKAVAEIAFELYLKYYPKGICSHLIKIIALNHDSIEDCKMFANETELVDKLFDLSKQSKKTRAFEYYIILDALKILNKNYHKSYLDFVLAAKRDDFARIVKMADIKHNLSDLKKGSMFDKYQLALYILEN